MVFALAGDSTITSFLDIRVLNQRLARPEDLSGEHFYMAWGALSTSVFGLCIPRLKSCRP